MSASDSEDILSSSSLSCEPMDAKDQNQAFNAVVPMKADVSIYFEPAGEQGGEEVMKCKACCAAHNRGEVTRVMSIKNKAENMRKHLKSCKYFCAEHNLEVPFKASRSKTTVAKADDSSSLPKFHNPPEGCKMIHIKYSRKIETVDITPGTTGAMLVKDLKSVFGIEDSTKCFLRKECV